MLFPGNEKRTKYFTTLTASTYHPFLRKQITLATMECKSEDIVNVAKFWRLFNEAYKKANGTEESFKPTGWVTDMAGSNLHGLIVYYGENVKEKVKTCEFHFMQSVNRRKQIFEESRQAQFVNLAKEILVASSDTAYRNQFIALQTFIKDNAKELELGEWLKWWNERRHLIFRAFTGFDKPRSNQAEVVHASWVNRGQVS